jgi:hypothetical protein
MIATREQGLMRRYRLMPRMDQTDANGHVSRCQTLWGKGPAARPDGEKDTTLWPHGAAGFFKGKPQILGQVIA